MWITEELFEQSLNRLQSIPTKYAPEDLKTKWMVNPFYPDGLHWDEEKLWKLDRHEIDELVEICKDNRLDENYKDVRHEYREMLWENWYGWPAWHMDEINDGWDKRVNEYFWQEIETYRKINMEAMRDHLYPVID